MQTNMDAMLMQAQVSTQQAAEEAEIAARMAPKASAKETK